jgi:hypothetical protein
MRREKLPWFSLKRCTSSRIASISDVPLLLPRGVCRNSGTPNPSCCSVLFGKPASPPPAAGFFVFRAVASDSESALRFLPAFFCSSAMMGRLLRAGPDI